MQYARYGQFKTPFSFFNALVTRITQYIRFITMQQHLYLSDVVNIGCHSDQGVNKP